MELMMHKTMKKHSKNTLIFQRKRMKNREEENTCLASTPRPGFLIKLTKETNSHTPSVLQSSDYQGHGVVEPGEAAQHVSRGETLLRHTPVELLKPLEEDDDPPAWDEDESQWDEQYA
ncbi:hypothetical protein ABZP36_028249 [Zizania latifolia]